MQSNQLSSEEIPPVGNAGWDLDAVVTTIGDQVSDCPTLSRDI